MAALWTMVGLRATQISAVAAGGSLRHAVLRQLATRRGYAAHIAGRLESAPHTRLGTPYRRIMARERTPKTLLRVEIVGAKDLKSSNFWTQSLSPACTVRMGMIEERTTPIDDDEPAAQQPVWGQAFFFDFNPLGTLDISLVNEQYLTTEELGKVRVTVATILEGLQRAHGQGLKTWETYFVLLTNEFASEPFKPGSNRHWFSKSKSPLSGNRLGRGHAPQAQRSDQPTGTRESVTSIGMYGTRSVPLPRVRGRLYINFDLVELDVRQDAAAEHARSGAAARLAHSSKGRTAQHDGADGSSKHFRVLPQPKLWPPPPMERIETQRHLAARAQAWMSWPRSADAVGGGQGRRETAGGAAQRAPFRILALDGGGVRGVFTAGLLERLCVAHPALMAEVDVICGTSTGGLLALMLADGYTPQQIKNIYWYHLAQVFTTTPARRYSPFCATYSKDVLAQVVELYCGGRLLGDLHKHVIITSFRLAPPVTPPGDADAGGAALRARWQPAVFSNIPQTVRGSDRPNLDMSVIRAALRTSAAPTLFPLHEGFTDGAVFANNPSLVGVTKVKSHFPRIKSADIRVLSLGTGDFPASVDLQGDDDADWGIRQWAPHLLDMLIDASSVNVDMNLRLLLNRNYHRLDPLLPWRINVDNTDAMDELVKASEEADLDDAIRFLQGRWSDPSPPSLEEEGARVQE